VDEWIAGSERHRRVKLSTTWQLSTVSRVHLVHDVRLHPWDVSIGTMDLLALS
jgi:outer membrane protein W